MKWIAFCRKNSWTEIAFYLENLYFTEQIKKLSFSFHK